VETNQQTDPQALSRQDGQYSILIVDDTPENIQVVAGVLGPLGYDLSFAVSGADALELVSTERYDLVLLDIMMPGMSGFEVAERMGKDSRMREVPIIFLTARSDEEGMEQGFKLGGVDYITKPFNHTELLARLRRHLEFYRQRRVIKERNRLLELEIKQRVQAERESAAAHRQLSDFVSNIEDIACVRGLDGAPKRVNEAFHRITGIDAKRLKEEPDCWLEGLVAEDQTRLRALFAGYPEGTSLIETEYRVAAEGGEPRRIHARMIGVRGEQGDYSGYHCIERDVTEQRLSEERRYDSVHRRLAATLEALPDAMLVFDQEGRLEAFHNPIEALLLVERNAERYLGKELGQVFAAPLAKALREAMTVADRQGRSDGIRCRPDPENDCAIELSAAPHTDPFSGGRRFVVLARDISERIRAERRLRQAAVVFDNSTEAIMVADSERRLLMVNPAFSRITGYREEEVLGRTPSFLRSGRQGIDYYRKLWEEIAGSGRWRGEFWDRRKTGEGFPADVSIVAVHEEGRDEPAYYIGFLNDLTERRRSEQQLQFLANHDVLTGLANRQLLRDRGEQAIHQKRREVGKLALLVIGLDGWERVNDTLGHEVGDQLLLNVAERIGGAQGDSDTLARIESATFALLMSDFNHTWEVTDPVRKILGLLQEPYSIDGYALAIGGAIGISIFPDDGENFDDLLRQASAAMARAARQDEKYLFFSADMTEQALARVELESDFHEALRENQFSPHFQPQVSLADGKPIGAEVLIRWWHPQRGMMLPGRFIPFAEESGLVLPMTDWLIDAVAKQLVEWLKRGFSPGRLAINLSPLTFRQPDPCGRVRQIIEGHGLDPHAFELEITESLILEDAEKTAGILDEMRSSGFALAIDDFGTGYSSLSYLNRLPIDKLKIDQSFVRGIPGDPNDEMIARTIVFLARGLGMRVIAEGIEEEAQRRFLYDAGCHEGQGWLFGKPMDADAFAAYYNEHG
jgi:diguanylate cyclase (GGDEF)-like protein/PAS domain S-box-containing protein